MLTQYDVTLKDYRGYTWYMPLKPEELAEELEKADKAGYMILNITPKYSAG